MTHHHNHHHGHDHEHDHKHNHDHGHDVQSTLSFDEKMIKLLKHWLKHNDDHAETYRDWAQKAKHNDMGVAAALLEEAAEMTGRISKLFEQAAESVKGK